MRRSEARKAGRETSISTSQDFLPNDTATFNFSGSGTPNGKVDFELYEGTGCTGEPVFFEKNVSLEGPDSDTAKTSTGARIILMRGQGVSIPP